jgi:hypothetical protein
MIRGYEQRNRHLWESLKKNGVVYTVVVEYLSETGKLVMVGDEEDRIFRYIPEVRSIPFFKGLFIPTINRIALISVLKYILLKNHSFPNPFGDVKFDIIVTREVHYSCIWHLWNIAPNYIDIDDYPIQKFDTVYHPRIAPIFRPIGDILVRRQMKTILRRAAGGWIPNKSQLPLLGKNYFYLPNIPIMPSEKYKSKELVRGYLLTVGSMNYIPNYTGVDRFLSEVWPLFHSCHPEVKYKIAGGGAPLKYSERWSKIEGVECVGFVDDLENAYSHCIAAIVPIFTGAGTCIKTLESLAYSRICLSTPFGARGLIDDCDESNGLFIFSNPNEFVDRYERIISGVDREKTEKSANEFIRENYSIEVFQNVVNSSLPKYD